MTVARPAAAATRPVPATAIGSGNPDDLALIARPSVALAQWWRPLAVVVPADDLTAFATIRLEGQAADVEDGVMVELTERGPRGWHAAFSADVAMLAGRFAAIAERDAIALRVEAIEGDACRRFHADYMRLRLITTYVGPGTEWLIDGGDRPPHRIETGHVAIFRGRDPDPVGILHRSPPIDGTGARRLVLAIDPPGAPSWDAGTTRDSQARSAFA